MLCVSLQKVLRHVLFVTPCRDRAQRDRLTSLLRPIINTLLWKCADSNK